MVLKTYMRIFTENVEQSLRLLGCIDISVEVHPCAGEGDSSLVGGSSFAVSGGESAKLL